MDRVSGRWFIGAGMAGLVLGTWARAWGGWGTWTLGDARTLDTLSALYVLGAGIVYWIGAAVPVTLLGTLVGLYFAAFTLLPPWLLLLLLLLDSTVPLRVWPAFRAWRGWPLFLGTVNPHRIVGPPRHDAHPYLYVVYPHGFLALSAIHTFAMTPKTFATDARPFAAGQVRLGVHALLVHLPWTRRVAAWAGLVPDTSKALLHELRYHGRSVAVVPEGVDAMKIQGTAPTERLQRPLRLAYDEAVRARPARAPGPPLAWCPWRRTASATWSVSSGGTCCRDWVTSCGRCNRGPSAF